MKVQIKQMEYLEIPCPCCKTILVIDHIAGEVIEARKPIIEQSTGDRLKDAIIKSGQQKKEIKKKFEESENAQKNRPEMLQNIFKKSLQEVKKRDDKSKPSTPFDFE